MLPPPPPTPAPLPRHRPTPGSPAAEPSGSGWLRGFACGRGPPAGGALTGRRRRQFLTEDAGVVPHGEDEEGGGAEGYT